MGLFMQFNRFSKAQRAPGGALNEAKQNLLAKAVLDQCDAMDGWPGRRHPVQPVGVQVRRGDAALRCAGGADSGDQCLSDAQIRTVRTAIFYQLTSCLQ